ncbi:hypothetical protein TWF281_000264 [Arthrobotrys megalospora]
MNIHTHKIGFVPNPSPNDSVVLRFTHYLRFLLFFVPLEIVIFSVRRLFGVRSNRVPLLADLVRTLGRRASDKLPISAFRAILDPTGRKVLASRRYSRHRANIYDPICHPGLAGYWISCGSIVEKCQPRDCDFVILIIHGGGYVSGHPAALLPGYLRMSEIFSKHGLKVGLFALEYSFAPLCVFPTQVNQARAAYDYLITDCGVGSEKLIVMGESAGGHLAISLMVSLAAARQNPYEMPQTCQPPAGLFLISPWVNMTEKKEPELEEDTDVLSQCALNEWSRLVFPNDDVPRAEVTHSYRDLSSAVPEHLGLSWKQVLPKSCWVCAGSDELFLNDIQSFIDHAQGAGVSIELEVAAGKAHAWPALEILLKQSRFLLKPMNDDRKEDSSTLSGFELVATRIIERIASAMQQTTVPEV